MTKKIHLAVFGLICCSFIKSASAEPCSTYSGLQHKGETSLDDFVSWNGADMVRCQNYGFYHICDGRKFNRFFDGVFDKNNNSFGITWTSRQRDGETKCHNLGSGRWAETHSEIFIGSVFGIPVKHIARTNYFFTELPRPRF
jgi:hypothetical protein